MTCTELARLLPDLLDGIVFDIALMEAAAAALERCPACRAELEAAREIRDLLAKLHSKGHQLVPSSDFETNLLIAIHHSKRFQKIEGFFQVKTQGWLIILRGNRNH